MAKIDGSVPVAGLLAPTDSLDTFAVTAEDYNRGGYRSVQTIEDLYDIPQDRRKLGMLVKVLNIGDGTPKVYTLDLPEEYTDEVPAVLSDDFWVEDSILSKASDKESYMVVNTLGDRDLIPLEKRSLGMLVKVLQATEDLTKAYYTLDGGLEDDYWVEENLVNSTFTTTSTVLVVDDTKGENQLITQNLTQLTFGGNVEVHLGEDNAVHIDIKKGVQGLLLIRGRVNTEADIATRFPTPEENWAVIVVKDSTQNNSSTYYMFTGEIWTYMGFYQLDASYTTFSLAGTRSSIIKANEAWTIPNGNEYLVGSDNLSLYTSGDILIKGKHYNEIGVLGDPSTKISFTSDIPTNWDILIKHMCDSQGTMLNPQVDWAILDSQSPAYIKNKPTIPPVIVTAEQNAIYIKAVQDINAHLLNTNNPHNVTKQQLGLGHVDDLQQLPMSYLDTDPYLMDASESKVPSQGAVKTYIDSKIIDNKPYTLNFTEDNWVPSIVGFKIVIPSSTHKLASQDLNVSIFLNDSQIFTYQQPSFKVFTDFTVEIYSTAKFIGYLSIVKLGGVEYKEVLPFNIANPVQDELLALNVDGTVKSSGKRVVDIYNTINNEIGNIKGNVSSDGDTLAKLRSLITQLQNNPVQSGGADYEVLLSEIKARLSNTLITRGIYLPSNASFDDINQGILSIPAAPDIIPLKGDTIHYSYTNAKLWEARLYGELPNVVGNSVPPAFTISLYNRCDTFPTINTSRSYYFVSDRDHTYIYLPRVNGWVGGFNGETTTSRLSYTYNSYGFHSQYATYPNNNWAKKMFMTTAEGAPIFLNRTSERLSLGTYIDIDPDSSVIKVQLYIRTSDPWYLASANMSLRLLDKSILS